MGKTGDIVFLPCHKTSCLLLRVDSLNVEVNAFRVDLKSKAAFFEGPFCGRNGAVFREEPISNMGGRL